MAKFASLDSLRAIRDWAKEKFQSKLPEVTTQDNGDVLSVVDGEWSKSTPEKELPEVTSADNGKVLAVLAGEWEKAEAPDGLPPVQSADNGKVLTVVEGEWAKADVPDELPAVTSQDNGKVLGVVEGQWAKTEPEDGLPEVTSSDNGKVLSVVEGAWAPAVPSGGSGLPEVTSEDNGDVLSVVNGAWAKSEPGYRAAMVDGAVIIPEQTLTPEEIESNYVAYPDRIGATVDVADWFNNNAVPETLPVTFNGVKHVTPTTEIDKSDPYSFKCWCGEVENGSPVFTTYPFCIELAYAVPDGFADVTIYVPTADSFTIKIAEEAHTAIPTEDFKLAVDNSYTQPMVTQETFWDAQSITTEAVSGKPYAAADGPVYDDDSPPPEKLNVVFDGTAYELPRVPMQIAYGAETDEGYPDFTTYPLFLIVVNVGSYSCLQLRTPQAGTYTLEATYDVATTAPTEKFKEAVKACGAPGYDVSTEEVQIAAAQSVTTAAHGPYNYGQITATVPDPLPDSVNVTFNGTSYENVPKHAEASLGAEIYGDMAFSEYPFVILLSSAESALLAQAAGTYTIEITGQVRTVTPGDDFKAAVKASGAGQTPLVVNFQYDTSAATTDKTFDEILAAWNAGQSIVFNCENYPQPGPDGYRVAAPAVIDDNDGDIEFQANYTYVASLDRNVYTIIMFISSSYAVCYYSHT